jgi:hypothetical protein
MSNHEDLIHQFSDATFRCGMLSGDEFSTVEYEVPYNQSEELEKQLLERDKKLVEALKAVAAVEDKMYGGDWDEIEEARNIACAALKELGEAV